MDNYDENNTNNYNHDSHEPANNSGDTHSDNSTYDNSNRTTNDENGYNNSSNYNNSSPDNGRSPYNGQQPYHQGNPVPGYQQPPYKQPNNTALASMIVGIFALLSCCLPPLQFVLGVIGILLVVFSKKGKPWSGFAIAGLVTSIISLLISIIMVLYIGFAYKMMKDPQFAPMFNEVYEMYEEMYESAPIQ